MTITEATIRERLAADQVKPCRVATWEEIEFLLGLLDTLRRDMDDCRKGIVRAR